MAFKFFSRQTHLAESFQKGESWFGESVEENLSFCENEGYGQIFERYFTTDSLILEAGCGLAKWVFYFKDRGYNIIGCDINPHAVRLAKGYNPSVPLSVADVRHLPYRTQSIDVVISLGVIEHFSKGPQKALKEKFNVLKPGGILFVAVPHNSTFRRLLVNHILTIKWLILRTLKYKLVFNEYRYSKAELIRFLQTAGFEILSCFPEKLLPPKHIGGYLDYIHLTGMMPKKKFEPPQPFSTFINLVRFISPWFISGMVLCVAKKQSPHMNN